MGITGSQQVVGCLYLSRGVYLDYIYLYLGKVEGYRDTHKCEWARGHCYINIGRTSRYAPSLSLDSDLDVAELTTSDVLERARKVMTFEAGERFNVSSKPRTFDEGYHLDELRISEEQVACLLRLGRLKRVDTVKYKATEDK